MQSAAQRAQDCTNDHQMESKVAKVSLEIQGATGRPRAVKVTDVDSQVGACIADVIRSLTFPKFKNELLRLNYVYKLERTVFADQGIRTDAQQLFEQGADAFRRNDYAEALHAFQQSYRMQPRPELEAPIAQSFERMEAYVMALQHYQRFLDSDAGSPTERAAASKAVARLRGVLEGEAADNEPIPALRPPPPAHDEPGVPAKVWIAGGTTLALGIATITTAVLYNNAEADLHAHARVVADRSQTASTRWKSYDEAWQAGHSANTLGVVTNVLLACTLVSTGVTVWFALEERPVSYPSQAGLQIQPALAKNAIGANVSGSF